MARLLTRQDLVDAELQVLLTLWVRGRAYRFASEDLEVANSDLSLGAATLHFLGGLSEVDIQDALDLGDVVPDRSAQIELLFQTDGTGGWAELVAGDADLGDSSGELAILRRGDDFTDRQVVLVGLVQAPTWGAPEEPIQFTLGQRPFDDRSTLVADGHEVNTTNWPECDEEVVGAYYPLIIGQPGGGQPATPGLLVWADVGGGGGFADQIVLVGAGRCTAVGGADTVTVYDLTLDASYTGTPYVTVDGSGRECTVIDVPQADLPIDAGDELWVGWESPSLAGRALQGGSAATRGAGDVLVWLLGRTTLKVDTARMAAAVARLNEYLIDTWVNEPRRAWDLIVEILEILPASLVEGPDGVYVVHWRWDAAPTDAVMRIDVAKMGGERVGPIQDSDQADIVNHVRVEYAVDGPSGQATAHITITGDETLVDAAEDVELDPYARASRTRLQVPGRDTGHRDGGVVLTELTSDRATAYRIGRDIIRRACMRRSTCRYLLPQEAQRLVPGDVVLLTDAGVQMTERVHLVRTVGRGPGWREVSFVSVPNWVRDL